MINSHKIAIHLFSIYFSLILIGIYCQNRIMNGRLYANYEPCPLPKVQITNSTDPFVASDQNVQEDKPSQTEGNFVLEVPQGTGNITIEAVSLIYNS